MGRRSMGMAVNEPTCPADLEGALHRLLVDIHDLGHDAGGVGPTASARFRGEETTCRERQREKAALERRVAYDRAQLLVGVIVGAEEIAVREQHRRIVEFGQHRIGKDAHARTGGETRAVQEIPIAVQDECDEPRVSRGPQRSAHPIAGRLRVVVADPGLKQIAEDVERFRAAGLMREESLELRNRLRGRGVEMQVRDEEVRHGGGTRAGEWAAR